MAICPHKKADPTHEADLVMTKKEIVPKYDFRKSYFYFCPICKVSENYQMPELMAQHFEKEKVVDLKRMCNCGYVMLATRGS